MSFAQVNPSFLIINLFFALTLIVTPSSAFAQSSLTHVLILGDSHMTGPMGMTDIVDETIDVADYLRKVDSGKEQARFSLDKLIRQIPKTKIKSIAVCGNQFNSWAGVQKNSCGIKVRGEDGQTCNLPMSAEAMKKNPFCQGFVTVPTLETLLDSYLKGENHKYPDLVIMQGGSGYKLNKKYPEFKIDFFAKAFVKILEMLKEKNIRCAILGPPQCNETCGLSKEQSYLCHECIRSELESFDKYFATVAPQYGCTYFSSIKLDPGPASDREHFSFPGGEHWAFELMKQMYPKYWASNAKNPLSR